MEEHAHAAVYILASGPRGTLYIGVTSDLVKRVWQHKEHLIAGFTNEHRVDQLVYFEQFDTIVAGIEREKQLKDWRRAWKLRLIEEFNQSWTDLYPSIL